MITFASSGSSTFTISTASFAPSCSTSNSSQTFGGVILYRWTFFSFTVSPRTIPLVRPGISRIKFDLVFEIGVGVPKLTYFFGTELKSRDDSAQPKLKHTAKSAQNVAVIENPFAFIVVYPRLCIPVVNRTKFDINVTRATTNTNEIKV
jgi:hypothetical protein